MKLTIKMEKEIKGIRDLGYLYEDYKEILEPLKEMGFKFLEISRKL